MPLQSAIHVDTLLSNISVKYKNAELIASQVFPEVSVKKTSDLYRTYTKNFRIPETIRANKAVSREMGFDVATASYVLEHHALKDYVSDTDADNYDLADLRADTTESLTDAIMRRMEKSVADLFTTTQWSLNVTLAATAVFSANTTVSNPIPVFDTACTTVINNSGYKPNFGVITRDGFVACKNHQSVLERVKYTSKELTPVMLAALFDLPELLISNAQYEAAAEGATSTMTNFWGNKAFIGYKPSRPGPLEPSCGYIFRKQIPMVKRWRDEERSAEAIEVNLHFKPKVVASLTGYLISGIV